MAAAALAPSKAGPPPWRITTEADDIMGQVPPIIHEHHPSLCGLASGRNCAISSSPSTFTGSAIFEDFGLTPPRTRNGSGLRMAMLRLWQTLGHTSNSESSPTRSGRRPFTTTPPFVSLFGKEAPDLHSTSY